MEIPQVETTYLSRLKLVDELDLTVFRIIYTCNDIFELEKPEPAGIPRGATHCFIFDVEQSDFGPDNTRGAYLLTLK